MPSQLLLALSDDVSLGFLFTAATALAGIAGTWAVAHYRVKRLEERLERTDEATPMLARALDSLAVVTGKIIDWEAGQARRLDDTESRSRANRDHIRRLLAAERAELVQQMKDQGVPEHLITKADASLDSREWPLSGEVAVGGKKGSR